jgi:hypothetical protein
MKNISRMLWAGFTSAVLLSIGAWPGCESPSHSIREGAPLCSDAEKLGSTVVSPHLDVPIKPHANILWCGTFQLAWNEACALAGGELKFSPPQPEMASILNKKSMTAADVDMESYVAEAGYVRDGICAKIKWAMLQKFGGNATPALLQNPLGNRPQDIIAYGYLQKDLLFATPFERADVPLSFGTAKVSCFGMASYKPGHEEMAKQVVIIDYRDRDDFIIELKTKSKGDRLILAKMEPGNSLVETLEALNKRIDAAKPMPAFPCDVLAVPKINFDITRNYTELTGRHLIPTAPGMAADLTLLEAVQNTRFQLDEKGVKLRSESRMEFGCSGPREPMPVHVMVFDKPFLLTLIRENRTIPYFALWIGNADLLVTAKE